MSAGYLYAVPWRELHQYFSLVDRLVQITAKQIAQYGQVGAAVLSRVVVGTKQKLEFVQHIGYKLIAHSLIPSR